MIGSLNLALAELRDFARRRGIQPVGEAPSAVFRAIEPMPVAGPDCISFCRFSDEKGYEYLKASRAGAVFILPEMVAPAQAMGRPVLLLPCPIPRLELLYLLRDFWQEPPVLQASGRNPEIHPDAKIGADVQIGPFCVIGRGVTIGDRTRIDAGCVIEWSDIGPDCRIGANSVIGGPGFGYEDDPVTGEVLAFPQIGRVRLGARVELGQVNGVDRASLGETVLEDDVKTDNFVHVGHNTRIGQRTKIAAMTIISGSVQIGSDCWLAPGVSVRDWRNIGDGALIGLGAVVTKNIEADQVVAGNPARPMARPANRYR